MEFEPYEFPKENGYFIAQSDHEVLRTRRTQMGMTQQNVANKSKIQLRQYQRLESGERSITSCSMRIGLAVCATLKLDPYIFFPEK